MVQACLDQTLIGHVAVEHDAARVVEGDGLVQPGAQGLVPGLGGLAGVGVIREILRSEAEPLDHACRLRHRQEDRPDRARPVPGDREQARQVPHADAVRGQEQHVARRADFAPQLQPGCRRDGWTERGAQPLGHRLRAGDTAMQGDGGAPTGERRRRRHRSQPFYYALARLQIDGGVVEERAQRRRQHEQGGGSQGLDQPGRDERAPARVGREHVGMEIGQKVLRVVELVAA
jgi:hypothetical protein